MTLKRAVKRPFLPILNNKKRLEPLQTKALPPKIAETAGGKKCTLLPVVPEKAAKKPAARTISLKALLAKKYTYLEGLPEPWAASFGALTDNFIALIWGQSANGKSSFILQLVGMLTGFGKVLYVSLEEGLEASIQQSVCRQLEEEVHDGKIDFADHNMKYEPLLAKLAKKKSARFIVIDSVQYWDVDYEKYKALKAAFPRKTFIFISHSAGKLPDGKTADKIRYDAGVKIRVEGFVAFVTSRYGGNQPFVIWPDGAKKYWGNDFRKILTGATDVKKARTKTKTAKTADDDSN